MISDWVVTELASALSIKRRMGQLDAVHQANALTEFTRLCRATFTVLPVDRVHFRRAASLASQYSLGLRSGDALHLAICEDRGMTVCTLDRRLSDACSEVGIARTLV